MFGFLRLLFVVTAVAIGFMLIFRPTQLRSFGRRARTVGLAYVAAILISAVLRVIWPELFGLSG
jgi:hypothetical protein